MPDCEQLLVDGHNLIHQNPKWKQWLKSHPQRARDSVADWVRAIHDVDGIKTTVVFDGRGQELTVEQPFKDSSFTLLFSPSGVTADTVIEKLVGKSDFPERVAVVTDDRIHQHTALALGAQVIGIKELEGWVDSCMRRVRRFLSD